nr:ATP-grasp domain-containing protein [Methanophagales archaeon]
MKTKILGTDPESIDIAEDRKRFSKFLHSLGIPQPESGYATSYEEALDVAARIGYPVLVRPSYVLGGRAMEIVYSAEELKKYMREAVRVSKDKPVLIDKFLDAATEIDVDAVCDGEEVLIGAIMEHIEQAGIHSGDSACVIPPQTLSEDVLKTVREYVRRIALSLRICGLLNVQLAVKDGCVFVLEVNPRASRTIPFVSKATGIPLAKIAAKVMLGKKLRDLIRGLNVKLKDGVWLRDEFEHVSVKEVVLPFPKLRSVNAFLGPEMKSTGEVMGIAPSFEEAFFKAQIAAENPLPASGGNVFISVCDADKNEALCSVAKKLAQAGLKIYATEGTASFLRERGIKVEILKKLHEHSPVNVLDMLLSHDIHLVINTVKDRQSYKDAHVIRRACIDFHIPYITTINAATAAANAILKMKENGGEINVKSLNELLQYHAQHHA